MGFLYNKRGHLDGREALSVWSVVKEVIDVVFVILGAHKFSQVPPSDNKLFFSFWIFSIMKMAIDLPLCISYLVGKWQHYRRHQKPIRRKRLDKQPVF